MHILVTGAAGMIGRKLTARLVKDGRLNGQPINRLALIDVVAPEKPAGFAGAVDASTGDLSAPDVAAKALAGRPDVIFHLAGAVSGEAEADFDKGYRVNLDGTRALIEAVRLTGGGTEPKLVFTSSIAVFGAPFPDAIPDDFISRRSLPTARRKRSANSCSPTIRGEIRTWEFGSTPCGWVFALSVEPKNRLHGVGSALLKGLSGEFKKAGVSKMRTMVARDARLPLLFFRSEEMMAGPYIQLEKDLV